MRHMTSRRYNIQGTTGRPERSLDLSPVRGVVNGACALVTGGGGSIGSALSLALCKLGAREVVALDSSEHALANLLAAAPDPDRQRLREVIASVRERVRLHDIVRRATPDVVFHAAALKHVHLGDRHPTECVLTNLVGVKNTLDAADAHGASLFVFISSDKAAAPTSVMGACKRLAELYIQGRNARGSGARAISVRFGNVLGSQGSVVEVFERQIAAGGPVTLTHRHMQRYFMSIDEAVGLILLAASRAPLPAAPASYLLDMGAPVQILHLAQRMIAASGREIEIVETGVREGEKFDEELYDEFESLSHTGVEGLLAVTSHAGRFPSDRDIDRIGAIAGKGDEAGARSAVFELLHECLSAANAPRRTEANATRRRQAGAGSLRTSDDHVG